MKTLLVGNFGAHNVGDELILCAALKDHPEAVVMTADSKASQKFCETEFKTVPFPPTAFRSTWFYIIDSTYRQKVHGLKRFDTIVFAGGGLFSIKFRACLLWFLVFKWLKYLNPEAEIRFEHQGVDQELDFFSRKLAQWTFKAANFVSVRDANSLQALERLEVPNAVETEDRVWLWLKELKKTHNLRFNINSDSKLVLVNARDYCHGEIFEVEHQTQHFPVKFVAFAPQDLAFVPLGIDALLPKNKSQVFELFSQAQQAVGERLHFLIVGAAFAETDDQIFVLRNPYAEKVKSFIASRHVSRYQKT